MPPPARGRGPACWEGANGAYRVSGCYLAGSKLNQFCKSSAEAFHVLSARCRKSRLSAAAALDQLCSLTHVSAGIVACLHKIVGIHEQKLWLSILLSLMVGMFLFTMIPMITPLTSTMMNVVLCLAGGMLFGTGLGAISSAVLNKRDLL